MHARTHTRSVSIEEKKKNVCYVYIYLIDGRIDPVKNYYHNQKSITLNERKKWESYLTQKQRESKSLSFFSLLRFPLILSSVLCVCANPFHKSIFSTSSYLLWHLIYSSSLLFHFQYSLLFISIYQLHFFLHFSIDRSVHFCHVVNILNLKIHSSFWITTTTMAMMMMMLLNEKREKNTETLYEHSNRLAGN